MRKRRAARQDKKMFRATERKRRPRIKKGLVLPPEKEDLETLAKIRLSRK